MNCIRRLVWLGAVILVAGCASSAAAVRTALKNAQTSLRTLSNNAGSQWTTQISGLKTALNQLHGTVTTLASKPSLTAVASVVTAVGAVKTAGTALDGKVKANCPNIGG
jgi:hypothetical protein